MESAETKPASNSQAKETLSQFVEDKSKLISCIAAFAALTVFSSTQVTDAGIQASLSGATLFGTVLLTLELFMSTLHKPNRQWRLVFFDIVLAVLLVNVGLYWFKTFPSVWHTALSIAVLGFLVIGLPALLTHLFGKVYKVVAERRFYKPIKDERLLHFQRVTFVSFVVPALLGLVWASHRLSQHPIKIHIPF